MKLRILYFAAARERAGLPAETLEAPPDADVAWLAAEVARLHPGLAPLLPRLRFAVNQDFAEPDRGLADGDEVALVPPVAGGSAAFVLTGEPIDPDAVVAAVAGPAHGGIVTFLGSVRGESRGRRVLQLSYEAYEPMAVAKLAAIGDEVRQRWPDVALAIHHRVGTLKVGELAVAIAAAAPHRANAFRACEHAIERLKQDVPIWKKERYEDGEEWVGLGP